MRRAFVLTGVAALLVTACGSGSTPTKAPSPTAAATPTSASTAAATTPGTAAGSPAASGEGLHIVLAGKDLCAYLTVDDFTAAGVNGATTVSENNTNNEFYCVYAGRSSGTGGIELDAFVYDDASDQDEGYNSLLPVDDVQDVTTQIANAQAAEFGTVISGGPRFAQIAVRSGNLSYGIGIPPTGDWQTQLVALANAFMSKVQTLASPAP
jgi:hypothetical protein